MAFGLHQGPQRPAVGHVDDMGAVGHLLAGRVGVAVHRHHFHSQALQCDDDFLAELAGAQQHDAGGAGGKRCADTHDWVSGNWTKGEL